MNVVSVILLFTITAVAEIAGRYLPWLWLNNRAPVWVLLPAVFFSGSLSGC